MILESGSTPHSIVDGKKVIMLCSNNYLNLSNHPRLIKESIDAAKKFGAGSGSVRAIAGTMKLHMDVEKRLAKFKGTESSLIYQTGFAANAGLIPQLVGKGDVIFNTVLLEVAENTGLATSIIRIDKEIKM